MCIHTATKHMHCFDIQFLSPDKNIDEGNRAKVFEIGLFWCFPKGLMNGHIFEEIKLVLPT